MQHLRGRIAKSDVPRTYVRTYVRTYARTYVRTYASSTVSRHFGAETKKKNFEGGQLTIERTLAASTNHRNKHSSGADLGFASSSLYFPPNQLAAATLQLLAWPPQLAISLPCVA